METKVVGQDFFLKKNDKVDVSCLLDKVGNVSLDNITSVRGRSTYTYACEHVCGSATTKHSFQACTPAN